MRIDDSIKHDEAGLRGTWEMVTLDQNGPVIAGEPFQLAFNGNQIAGLIQATYTLNPMATPPQIDIVPQEGPDKGKTYLGIYLLEGDRLKLCVISGDGCERPSTFLREPERGKKGIMQSLTMRRVKQ